MSSISIVIPCYNSAHFLPEAIESVENYSGKNSYEVVIVDDGSTEIETLELLKVYDKKGYTILYQPNKGPAAARNNGIKNSKSEYILLLDSDNKIRSNYIDEGIQALEDDVDVAVVYGNPFFFGDAQQRVNFKSRDFDIKTIIAENYIDMCAVVRKSAWQDVSGLDEERLLMGHEDWEFWINLYKRGWKFKYIDEILFDYRVRENSLLAQTSGSRYIEKVHYIYKKHVEVIYPNYLELLTDKTIFGNDIQRPFRSLFKYINIKYFKRTR